MFTQTNSPSLISNFRNFSHEDKVVPALKFNVQDTEDSNNVGELLILLPNIINYKVRLLSELLYLASTSQVDDEFVLDNTSTIINMPNNMEVIGDYYESIVSKYDMVNSEDNMLELNKSTYNIILISLKVNKSILLTKGLELPHCKRVTDLEVNTVMDIANQEEWFPDMFERLSNRDRTVSFYNRYFYPEDCFNFPSYGRLDYHNASSSGMYNDYETALYAYTHNPHFKKNRDLFKETYCACGAELVIRMNMGMYTTMHCISPFCHEKMSISLSEFAGELGIVGLGDVTLEPLTQGIASKNLMTRGYSYVTLRELLHDDNGMYLKDAAGHKWLDFLDEIRNYNGLLSNLIQAINLPYLSSEASKILTDDVLTDDSLTPAKLARICKEKGKHDLKFVLNLWLSLEDYRFIVNELATETKREVLQEYLIYITKGILLDIGDGTQKKMSKSAFVSTLNEILEQQGVTDVIIKLNKSLTSQCKALIADHPDNTGSINNARKFGVPILTSREFLLQLGGE